MFNKVVKYQKTKFQELEETAKKGIISQFNKSQYSIPKIPDLIDEKKIEHHNRR